MKLNLLTILAIIIWVLLLIVGFLFPPDVLRYILASWGVGEPFLTLVAGELDEPTGIAFVTVLLAMYFILLYGIVKLRDDADVAIGSGMENPESCISADIENQSKDDFGLVKVGGTKDIPVKGGSMWINPLTHIHRWGRHLIFTANMTPNTEIVNAPFGIKRLVRALREINFIKLKNISVGFFTSLELSRNLEFRRDDYKEFITKEDGYGEYINTNTFVENLTLENRNYDAELQQNEGENYSISKNLKAHTDTGKAFEQMKKKTFLEQLGLVGGGGA